jgi:hypothetical protein
MKESDQNSEENINVLNLNRAINKKSNDGSSKKEVDESDQSTNH